MSAIRVINRLRIGDSLPVLSLVLISTFAFTTESHAQTGGAGVDRKLIGELTDELKSSCMASNVVAVFQRDLNKQDIQGHCENAVDNLVSALSDRDACSWNEVTDAGTGNDACVQQVLGGMHVPDDRVAILWTGKKAQHTALTASRARNEARYISLEATQWGAILDQANSLPSWQNRSKHWAVMSAAFTEKTQVSSVDVPIIAGISFPRDGAFVQSEVPRIVGTTRDEYILVDLYGADVCELEKQGRIKNYCGRDHFDATRQQKCENEALAVACSTSCADFVTRVQVHLKKDVPGFDCGKGEIAPSPKYDRTMFYCADRAAPIQGLDQNSLETNIEGTRDFPANYLSGVIAANRQLVLTCLERRSR